MVMNIMQCLLLIKAKKHIRWHHQQQLYAYDRCQLMRFRYEPKEMQIDQFHLHIIINAL